MPRCPGQDQRFWKPEDIFEIECPSCARSVELWKDEPQVKCPHCKLMIANPKIDLGCAKWCQYATECLGEIGREDNHALREDRQSQVLNPWRFWMPWQIFQ